MGLTSEEWGLLLESFTSDRSKSSACDNNSQHSLKDASMQKDDPQIIVSDADDLILTDRDENTDYFEYDEENEDDEEEISRLGALAESPTKVPKNIHPFSTASSETVIKKKENFKLFENINIYVNGYTDPGRLQLHRLMTLYGGKFTERLTSKKAVTHIIASNLTPKKMIEFANYKVLKPEWVTESIKAQKILPWQEYSLFYKPSTNIKNNLPVLNKDTAQYQPLNINIDCNHPEFLKLFYSKSRLHFLSTNKMLLQSKYLKYTSPPPLAKKKDINQSPFKTVYYIDFDCFFAKVSSLMDPTVDINKDCIVVSHGQNNSDIASCNYVARSKYGIRNGEWVSSAKLKSNNTLKILPYYFDKYKEISEYLHLFLKNKFDCIIPLSIDECIAYDYGEIDTHETAKKCEIIRKGVEELTKCTVSIGVSTTLYVSKLALKYAKPNGYKIVDPYFDDVGDFIKSFKLTDLPGIGFNIVDKIKNFFSSLGIVNETPSDKGLTIGDLLLMIKNRQEGQKPIDSALKILTPLGDKLSKRLNNYIVNHCDDKESLQKLDDPLTYFERKSISADINYGVRFRNVDQVYKFLERVCDYLLNQLKEGQLSTNHLVLKIAKRLPNEPIEPAKHMGMGRCEFMSKMKSMKVHTSEKFIIFPEMKSLFHQLYKSNSITDIRGLSVQFMKLKKSSTVTPKNNLFAFDMFKLRVLDKEAGNENDINVKTPNRTPVNGTRSSRSRSPVKDFFDNNSYKKRKQNFEVPDRIDMRVLKELPVDLQKQLLAEYHLINKISNSNAKRILEKSSSKKQKKGSCEEQQNAVMRGRTLAPKVSFQHKHRPKDIQRLLHSWVKYSINMGPRDEDKLLFLKFCKNLFENRKFSNLILYVSCLENLISFHKDEAHNKVGFDIWNEFLVLKLQPLISQCS